LEKLLKRFKLGTKILIGLVGVMLIVGAIIVVSVVNLNSIKTGSEELYGVHIAEVEILQELDDHFAATRFNTKSYMLSDKIEFFDTGMEELQATEEHMEELKSTDPEIVTEMNADLVEYRDYIESVKVAKEQVVVMNDQMAVAADEVATVVDAYYMDQIAKFSADLSSGASNEKLSLRVAKMDKMSDISLMLTEIRVNYVKSLYLDDNTLIQEHMGEFDTIDQLVDSVLAVTTKDVDIQRLNSIKDGADVYKKSIGGVLAQVDAVKNAEVELGKLGEELQGDFNLLFASGFESTKTISEENIKDANNSYMFLIWGSVIAFIFGIAFNLYLTREITRSVKELIAVADTVATGDVDVTIDQDENAKDEINTLKGAMHSMIENVKSQVSVVEAVSDGNFQVEVQPQSEKDVLNIKLKEMLGNIKSIISETEKMESEVIRGNLRAEADETNYAGGWKNLIGCVNNVAKSMEGYIRKVPTTISIFDKNMSVVYMNDNGLKTVGRDYEQVVGRKCYDLFNTGDCNTDKCACARALRDGVNATSETQANINNNIYEVAYEGLPIKDKDNNTVGVLELIMDQTDTVNAQKKTSKQMKFQSDEVQRLISSIDKLAKGDFAFRIPHIETDDETYEIGVMFDKINHSLSNMTESIMSYVKESAQILTEMSRKNLDQEITREYVGDFIDIKNAINNISDSFNEMLEEIKDSAQEVTRGSEQVAQSAQQLSQGATEQASEIEEITAAITQIAEQTKENAANAGKANDLSEMAKDDAKVGNNQMVQMIDAMNEINESSTNISKIIKVIDEIAFQTNILALNAAVEAARAGQHGKGFAVVADEVRNLAARSADAAKETTTMIENSIKKVQNGTEIAQETAKALEKIVDAVTETSDIVSDIAKASNEQATGVVQINDGINQISSVTQHNSATAEESAAASEEMTSQAQLLETTVKSFNLRKGNRKSINYSDKEVSTSKRTGFASRKSEETEAGNPLRQIDISLDDTEFEM